MRKYQYILFDLDGTLLDTLDDLYDTVNAALSLHSLPLRTREEVRCFVGNGIRKLMERAVPNGTDNPYFNSCFEDFKRIYVKKCETKTRPYDNIVLLLELLNREGFKIAIVSNKIDSAVKKLSAKYFNGLINTAIGDVPMRNRKPSPDPLYEAMRNMGADPNIDKHLAVYIGDSDVDIETARRAGIDCISVLWGFRDKDVLCKAGATTFAKSPNELYALITGNS